jgi:hypothetical protein
MFGIDIYVLETLIPSVLGVLAMAGVMTWAFLKAKGLMEHEPHK